MDLSKIAPGANPPEDVNVVIEVPMNSMPVKYEFDKSAGALFVDRFLPTAMFYPVNYGFIPNTLGGDGDPVDALVLCPHPVFPNSVIRCRAIGVLKMEDESGVDEKILFVPISKLSKYYDNIKESSQLPEIQLQSISHFFERYKELEKNKWVKILGWGDSKEAAQFIKEGIERYKK